jgi:hypothetical protein
MPAKTKPDNDMADHYDFSLVLAVSTPRETLRLQTPATKMLPLLGC